MTETEPTTNGDEWDEKTKQALADTVLGRQRGQQVPKGVFMQIDLAILDRYTLLRLLPPQGGIGDMRAIRELRESLEPNEEEQKAIGITPFPDGSVRWDRKKAVAATKAVEFTERQREIVRECLRKLEGEKKLESDMVPLWDKFGLENK